MRHPSRPALSTLAQQLAADPRVCAYAARHPDVPPRLAEIVRWVETRLHDAGLKLTVERGGAASIDWRQRFGLTPAETRLAQHMLAGGTAADYAAQHRLSPHTVRNHLRAIYAKTDTNRQVSLLQLLLRDPGKNP
jgi:DNA-binding CsgD family transcriptional regulator